MTFHSVEPAPGPLSCGVALAIDSQDQQCSVECDQVPVRLVTLTASGLRFWCRWCREYHVLAWADVERLRRMLEALP